jgi:SAM-dependent methyltransferase
MRSSSSTTDSADRREMIDREAAFHDRWAESTSPDDLCVMESFESVLAQENRFALQLMGDLHGKIILDLGAGLGESSVYFALRGARVIAQDISPKMLSLGRRLASQHGTQIEAVICPAECLGVRDDTVDFCYAANVLHHVTDRRAVLREIRRVLKPGGCVISWDPLAYNPIIGVYRRIADVVRSSDEKPLTFQILDEYGAVFAGVQYRVFWLTALVIFLRYYFVDRLHPNQQRYWKKILKEDASTLKWMRRLVALDNRLLRLLPLRYMAWTILVHARK